MFDMNHSKFDINMNLNLVIIIIILGNGDETDDCTTENGLDLRTRDGKCPPLDWGTAWQVQDLFRQES